MMGTRQRNFVLLIHVSVEDLVPVVHFYRYLEKSLDLLFVREFVQETYAGKGRPSIDLQSDHLYQLQQFALSEEQLLCQMEEAITELEALGKPFTQRELC